MENTIYFSENKTKVLVCVFNRNHNENADRLLDLFSSKFDTVVLDCDSDVKNDRFILLDDVYYGGQYRIACEKMIAEGYDWLYVICSDVLIDDINAPLVLDSIEKISYSTNVGVFSPSVKQGSADDWKNFNNHTGKMCLTHMINGFSVLCKRDVLVNVFEDIKDIKYGWAEDIYTCYRSCLMNYLCVIDNSCEVFHQPGTSYSLHDAAQECISFLAKHIPNYHKDDFTKNNNDYVLSIIKI